MEERSGVRLGPIAIAAVVVVGGVAVFFGILGWLSARERSTAPIEIMDTDVGVHVVVEPGDVIDVGLLGHPADESAAWVIREIDEAVVETLLARHEPRSATLPDAHILAGVPAVVRELWSTVPVPDRPPDEVNPDGERWFYPMSHFQFAGRGAGESDVLLELPVGGEVFHSFEFTITVVDGDACDYSGEDSSTKVPSRCG